MSIGDLGGGYGRPRTTPATSGWSDMADTQVVHVPISCGCLACAPKRTQESLDNGAGLLAYCRRRALWWLHEYTRATR